MLGLFFFDCGVVEMLIFQLVLGNSLVDGV